MSRRITLAAYLAGEETNRPQELAYGVVREPPTPTFEHQIIVGALFRRLDQHVRRYGLGRVVASPMDVVLDRERHLVVQPDVLFVSHERLAICTDRVWGAPDLTIEVLSMGSRRHDCVVKAGWYRQYSVREYWLVDPFARTIEARDLGLKDEGSRTFQSAELVRSRVLPRSRLKVGDLFDQRRAG